jgi:hypothetical protein
MKLKSYKYSVFHMKHELLLLQTYDTQFDYNNHKRKNLTKPKM